MPTQLEETTTPAIASNAATVTSGLLTGFVMHIKLEVRTAAGAASSNTCTVTITDNVLARTLLTATGITGISNHYQLQGQAKDAAGAAITGVYVPFFLANQRVTVAVTSGTNTDYVKAFILVL